MVHEVWFVESQLLPYMSEAVAVNASQEPAVKEEVVGEIVIE